MKDFKVKSTGSITSSGKHVGAVLPRHVYCYLSLYAITHGITKTNVIRQTLTNWQRRKLTKESEKQLISRLKQTVVNHWKAARSKNPNENLNAFKDELSNYLIGKGIEEKIVQQILQEL